MIVYEGTKSEFQEEINNNSIQDRLDSLFLSLGVTRESLPEYNSWKNSLPRMASIISERAIDDDVRVALEYQIPLTSKRVDFMIAGSDDCDRDSVVIIELKQWETCRPTQRESVVKAFTGGAERDVAHPSQQAYAYAKLIENFNESVRENSILLKPCAYLHNFREENRQNLCSDRYASIISVSPVFLARDGSKLGSFISNYVRHRSSKNLFDIIEHGKLKPSKSLQTEVGSILLGNSAFEMVDEQQVAYATVLARVEKAALDNRKHTIIVKGGPGTGKSVIAVNLLAKIINNGHSAVYVSKNSAPRYTFSESLIKGRGFSLSYLKGLFKGSGSFIDMPGNTYDCILVDEAHRLNLKSGLYSNQGENQIKEIINASKISVFFIDEDQIVTMKDIGRIEEIKRQAKAMGSIVHEPLIELTSQFRCNGSDGYLAFLDDVLGIRETANQSFDTTDYDIRVFDSPSEMRETLRAKNTNNRARMIAGYCYPWNSRNDKTKTDIVLEDGFTAQWNFTTDQFATDPESFEQVGCIHSTQGLEFDYVGIIIGRDLRYESARVITDSTKRAKSDGSIRGESLIPGKTKKELLDRIIRNTYRTLLSRGQKGCYVYCEDKPLSEYLKERLQRAEKESGMLRKRFAGKMEDE